MEAACFQSQDWYSDKENKSLIMIDCSGSQENNTQSQKLASEPSDKTPRFGKRRRSSQQAGYENIEDSEKNRSGAGQVLSEMAGMLRSQGSSTLSQVTDIKEIDSKDKTHWYVSFKRERAINIKLTKRVERYEKRMTEISKKVQELASIT